MAQQEDPSNQELQARIEALEAQVSDLSTRCEAMERTLQDRWP
jgi:uncharacterized protein YceH (UPF0502 family)